MKFIDEATITVQSGDGGRGCVSFRREKFIPRGGPDGGDGGAGGSVVLRATAKRRTLYQFRNQKLFKAERGGDGQGRQKTGRAGQDRIIEVPVGTLVRDAGTGELIKDFTDPEETFVIARGGRGGQGNTRFKSSTNRAPRFAQPGEPGETRELKLDLKLLADVGLIGLPNAGKSTLISAISSASPKVADYPFTTLTPILGVVRSGWGEPFVVADIPGLIEGAHRGVGLGIRFLKHVERTRLLVHLVDADAIDPDDPLAAYRTVDRELDQYNPDLARKRRIVALNKCDLPGAAEKAELFRAAPGGPENGGLSISARSGDGLDRLISQILAALDRFDEA